MSERAVQNLRLSYHGVFLGDAIEALMRCDLGSHAPAGGIADPGRWPALEAGARDDGISYSAIMSAFQDTLQDGDTFVVEVGTISGLMSNIRLADGVTMISQTLWGSIGACTPMVLGVELANRGHAAGRTLLVTGDGAHLMTANEIGTFGRVGAKPIIVVINKRRRSVEGTTGR